MAPTVATERYPRYGFKKLFQVLCRQGNNWNHKRVHRIYCLLKLNFRRKGKQRLPVRNPAPLATPEAMNQSWSIDFMHDALVCGRRFRTFNVVDDFNREALATERWLAEYNSERPHESLNHLTPEEYQLMAETSEISKSAWN
ncbi:hypothetical protein PEC331060_07910 [Pectobacterium carotovorum subsp. carotovorum]|nr:hypothetical protein PEC331060_07910 [Pectobacterium carotovorum subsp. carotovorum]